MTATTEYKLEEALDKLASTGYYIALWEQNVMSNPVLPFPDNLQVFYYGNLVQGLLYRWLKERYNLSKHREYKGIELLGVEQALVVVQQGTRTISIIIETIDDLFQLEQILEEGEL